MAGSGTSLMVQWLRLHILNAGTLSLIPGWKTGSTDHNYKILHAVTKIWCSQKKKKKMWQVHTYIAYDTEILFKNMVSYHLGK